MSGDSDASPRSVLLIDDDRESCVLLGDLIRRLRPAARVWTAFGGSEGAALALRHRPSAVVLDLEMPGMDGEETAACIRAHLGQASCVLVAVSGSQKRLELQANLPLFDRCFLKPVGIEVLLQSLDL